jgi:hypothetical protein
MDTEIIFTKNLATGVVDGVLGVNANTLITTGRNLGQLNDVDTTNVALNKTLIYNLATAKWEADFFSFSSCNDVTFTNLQSSNVVKWNGTRWINRDTDYCVINIYGKIKDSAVGSDTEVNLLNPANYDDFNITRSSNNGINSDTANFDITGFTGTLNYKVDMTISYNVVSLTSPTPVAFNNIIKNNGTSISSIPLSLQQPTRNYVIQNTTINRSLGTVSLFCRYPTALVGQSPYDINIAFSALEF